MERAKRRTGSTVHLAVGTLGQLPALHVTLATEQDRDQVAKLAAVQSTIGETAEVAVVEQGSYGETPKYPAATEGIELAVVKLASVKHGFVLRLPPPRSASDHARERFHASR